MEHDEPDPAAERTGGEPTGLVGPLVVVLDVANVMGSRPDGWWRDRAGAAQRVLAGAARVLGSGRALAVVAVLEGRARAATAPQVPGLETVLAPGAGDDTIVDLAVRSLTALDASSTSSTPTSGARPGPVATVVVVTADRGLRQRLPGPVLAVGPRWWFDLVDGAGG